MKHTGYTYTTEAKVSLSLGDITLLRYLCQLTRDFTFHLPGPGSFLWGWAVHCQAPVAKTVTLEDVDEAYMLEGDDYIGMDAVATWRQLDSLCKVMESSVLLKDTRMPLRAKAQRLTECLYGTLKHMRDSQLSDMDFPGVENES